MMVLEQPRRCLLPDLISCRKEKETWLTNLWSAWCLSQTPQGSPLPVGNGCTSCPSVKPHQIKQTVTAVVVTIKQMPPETCAKESQRLLGQNTMCIL